jgi:hypothetical protein
MAQAELDDGGFNHILFETNTNQESRSWKFFSYMVSRSMAVFVTQVVGAFYMIDLFILFFNFVISLIF